MDVRLTYQPYAENMSVFIDGRPIGLVSALSKYQTSSFTQWCGEILPAIAVEVNDHFTLTYVGRKCEFDLLQHMVSGCPECTCLRYEQPLLADSAYVRLKKLSRLVMNGVECTRFSAELHVYTDCDMDEMSALVRAALPKLSFCRIQVSVHNVCEAGESKWTSLAILSSHAAPSALDDVTQRVCGILSLQEQDAVCLNETIVLPGHLETINEDMSKLLEMVFFPGLLTMALQNVTVDQNTAFFPDVFVLDKIEAQTFVKLPRSIETGCVAPLQVSTIPKTVRIPEVVCRVSNDEVITYTPDGLRAVGTGEAVVEVYEAGKTVPLCRSTITAYRTNRIQKLAIKPDRIRMCVGEKFALSYSQYPATADDQNRVQLVSENGTIAGVLDRMSITGRGVGDCAVYFQAEKAQSDRCLVSVYPKLESISITMDAPVVHVNSLTKVKIIRCPEDAVLDKLTIKVEPSTLGSYEAGSGSFFARQPGSGQLTVISDRGQVKASIPVEVKAKPSFNLWPVLIGVGLAGGALLLWLLSNT